MSFASKYSHATPSCNVHFIIAGLEDFLYCDTDSVKYVDHGQRWEKFNNKARAASEADRVRHE